MNFLIQKRIFFCLIFGVLVMVSGVVISDNYFSKQYNEVTTKSGLKILFLEDQNLPYIQFVLWFLKAGSDYDYKDKNGLNAMTANLLEQGAGGLSSEVIQENIDYYGAKFGADTNRQFSKLIISGLSSKAKELWGIFLKITTEAHLDQKEFDLLKQQFLENRYQELDDPSSVANEVWRQNLFQEGSPAGQSDYGTITSLKNIALEDVKHFFRDYYLKGQPILTVVGQFTSEFKKEIISSLESQFLEEKKEQPPLSVSKKSSFFKLLQKKDQIQSQIIIGFQTQAFPTHNPRTFIALNLANMIFGGGGIFNNRLMLKLREEMGLTYGVGSGVSLNKNYGMFYLSSASKTESTGLFLKESLNLLKDFQEKGVTKEELEVVKLVSKSQYLKSIETPENRLNRIIYYHYYLGVDISFVNEYVSIIDDISVEEVNEAIKKYLTTDSLSVLIYGDPSVKEQLLKIKGLGQLEEIFFENFFSQELSVKD